MSHNEKENVISFRILEDLSTVYSDSVSIKDSSFEEIMKGVKEIAKPFMTRKETDSTVYYFKDDYYSQEVAEALMKKGYYVVNRYEKYYVVAFALNYTRFEVFSKDCDKETIKWRYDDSDDVIEGKITDDDYNENPVVKLLKKMT